MRRNLLKATWEGLSSGMIATLPLVVFVIFFCMSHMIKSIRALEDSVRDLDDSDYYQEQYFTLKDFLRSNDTVRVVQTALYKERENEIKELRRENKLLHAVLNGKYKIALTYDDVKHIVIPPFSNRQGWYSGVGGTEMTIEDLYNTELERFRMELDKYEGKK